MGDAGLEADAVIALLDLAPHPAGFQIAPRDRRPGQPSGPPSAVSIAREDGRP